MVAYSTLSDLELVALLKQSEQGAFSELYNRYKNPLYFHAYRMLHDNNEARDLVQDLFLLLWTKRESLVIPAAVDAYLYSAVKNRILNFIAHQKVIAKYTDAIDGYLEMGIASTDEKVREKELIAILESEIALLPPKMREVFELSRNEELSHKEIAQKLSISDKTVKKQINKAIKVLRYKINLSLFLTFFG